MFRYGPLSLRIGLYALVAVALLACGFPLTSGPASKPLKKVGLVTAPVVVDPSNASFTVPLELGYYAEEGLDVTLLPSQGGGGAATQSIATGSAEFSNPVPDPMLTSLANGVDLGLVYVYSVLRHSLFENMVVKPESPVQDYKDLKGKKIGVVTLTPSSLGFPQAVLRENGLNPDRDVEFIAVGRGQQAAVALQSGQIDALNDTAQALAQLKVAGFNFRGLPSAKIAKSLLGTGVLVRRDYFQANRDVVLGFARAVTKGTVFFLTNPEAGVQIHWKVYPETKPKNVANDQEALKTTMTWITPGLPNLDIAGEKDPRWGAYAPEDVQAQVNFLGFADKIKEPMRYFLNDLVPEINKMDLEPIRQQARSWKP